jgi:hypothetical protein
LKDGASQTLANADKAEQEKTWNEAFKKNDVRWKRVAWNAAE